MDWLHTWNGFENWHPLYDSLTVLIAGSLCTWLVITLNGRK